MPSEKPRDDNLTAQTAQALAADLARHGIRNTVLADIITQGKTRGQVADELREHLRGLPKQDQ